MIAPILCAGASRLKQERVPGAVLHTAPQQCSVQPSSAQGLGFTAAILLHGIVFVADSSIALVASRALAAEDSLSIEIQRALAAVHATMVELPNVPEAAAINIFVERFQVVRQKNQRLTDTLQQLKKDHAELTQSSHAENTQLQLIVDRSRAEIRSLQSERKNLQTQLAAYGSGRGDEDDATHSGRQTAHREGSARQAVVASEPPGGSDAPAKPLNWPIDAANPTDAPKSSVVVAARQIADGLQQAHREAVLRGREERFVLDVEERRFTAGGAQPSVQLEPLLSVGLLIGRSEVIDGNTGQIRFFPDGTSSGGRIRLGHDGYEAEVTVQWSNGEVFLSPPD